MEITGLLSDEAVLQELGRRLRRHRLDGDTTQARLAREAGVSVPTVQRLEAGSSVQLTSLVRILRALGLLEGAEALAPEPGVRPMELLERQGRPRQRASSEVAAEPEGPWTWGE